MIKKIVALLSAIAVITGMFALSTSPVHAASGMILRAPGPSAPQNFLVASGDTQLILTWDTPASDGGSPITGYKISLFDTATLNTAPVEVTVGVVQTYTFTQLTNGNQYDVELYAFNAVDPGTPVMVQATPREMRVPEAPSNLVVTPGDTELSITWDDPADNGGSDIVGYNITWNPNANPISVNIGITNSYTITGLINGTNYTVTVAAINSVGTGGLIANNGTPEAGPGIVNPPANTTVTPTSPVTTTPAPDDSSQTITVNWNTGIGTCSYATSVATVGDTFSAPTCTAPGYVFTGWDREVPFTAATNVTVTAEWQQIPGELTITAVTTRPKSTTFTYAYTSTIPVDTFTVVNSKGALACSSQQGKPNANRCTAVGAKPGTYYVYAVANGVEGPRDEVTVKSHRVKGETGN